MSRFKIFAFIALITLSFGVTWVADIHAAGIQILDPHYRLVTLVKDSPLSGCNGAIIGTDGALYVTNVVSNMIIRIDLTTMKATTFVPPYAGVFIPDDITADDQGNLFVTGTTPVVGEVYRIDKNGRKTVIASGFKAPNGIHYNPRTGRLFMTECWWGDRVWELDPTGAKEPRLLVDENLITVPQGFGFDPDTNDLIIPDQGTGKILRVNPETGIFTTIMEGFVTPVALEVGPDKKAYIPEFVTGAVYRISLDGQSKEKLAHIMPGLDNVALTPEGRLFITSYWDATVFEVSTDGSGKYKTLFPLGESQICGIAYKGGDVLTSDSIMIRKVQDGKYLKTKLNAQTTHGMPLPGSVAEGPGEQVLWPDWLSGAVTLANPNTGEFKVVAGQLSQPMSVLMNKERTKLWVAEYGAGQITEVGLTDGAKKILTTGLEGPLALALVGDRLYVAEAKAGRISQVDPNSGKKEVFLSGNVGRPGALADDGAGNLLVLDGTGQRLLRASPQNLAISVVASSLPVAYLTYGSYPPLAVPMPMAVSPSGDIYLATMDRGVIMLKNIR